MEEEYKFFQMGIGMKGIMLMASLKGMGFIRGIMGPFTKGSSKMESAMATANGFMAAKNMKEIM